MRPIQQVDPTTGRVTRTKIGVSLRCGKQTYSSRKMAKAAAVWASREMGEDIRAYKCPRGCHCWHIGHPPASREVAS